MNKKDWKEFHARAEKVENGDKGLVLVLDKKGFMDISSGLRASEILPFVFDWERSIEKETRSVYIPSPKKFPWFNKFLRDYLYKKV